jgi:DNA-binding NarL/FixJ family response regulator
MHLSIALLDSSEISRFALNYFLKSMDKSLIQVFCACSKKELIQVLGSKDIDTVLVNYSTIAKSTILEFEKYHSLFPRLNCVVFNYSGSTHELLCIVKSGIKGVFDLSSKLQDVLIQLPLLNSQEYLYNDLITPCLLKRVKKLKFVESEGLKMIEIQFIRCRYEGLSNGEIAKRFNYSLSHVKNMFHGILSKTGVKNTQELMRFAVEEGFVEAVTPPKNRTG